MQKKLIGVKQLQKNPRSGENNMLSDTDGEDNKDQNADTTKGSASDENKAAQTTDVEGRKEGTTTGAKGAEQNDDEITATVRILCGSSSTVRTWNPE